MLRNIFKTKQKDQELKVIEKRIDEIKNSSPCEAGMLTLMRSVGKKWVPKDVTSCKSIFKQHSDLVSDTKSTPAEFRKKFADLYPQFIRCVNAKFIAQAIDEFGQPQIEPDSSIIAKTIKVSNESMKHAMIEQNRLKAIKSKKEIDSGEEMAENLHQFRQFHYRCRAEGSEESRAKADEHINAIKSFANKKRP